MTQIFNLTARKLHAALAPVGLAWEAVKGMVSGMDLYHRDGRHASPLGSYLTACVFYAALFDTNPRGLPGSFNYKGKMWLDLDEDRASLLQNVAWETVSTMSVL